MKGACGREVLESGAEGTPLGLLEGFASVKIFVLKRPFKFLKNLRK
jgi:hypothetical protein